MKTHDVEQGGLDWMVARLGLPTASRFDQLLTPKTRKPAAARSRYRAELLAEWMLGQAIDSGSSIWMERGTDTEGEARCWYELEHDIDVERVGFITRDDGKVGGSPDGLVLDDGGLEIKVPGAVQHVQFMISPETLAGSHIGQVQGLMYLTGRTWWDVLSYNPELPAVLQRVPRDDEYIGQLVEVLDPFIERLDEEKERLAEHRVSRPWHMEAPATPQEDGA